MRPARNLAVVTGWLVREYHDDDLEDVVHLWDETAAAGQLSVFSVGECLGALREGQPAVVAAVRGASTEDFLVAIRQVRPTVTAEEVAAFREDIAKYARV